MPGRSRLSGGATAVLVTALTIGATACTGSATRAVEATQPSPDQSYQAARQVVIRHLTAVADRRPLAPYTAPRTVHGGPGADRLSQGAGRFAATGRAQGARLGMVAALASLNRPGARHLTNDRAPV